MGNETERFRPEQVDEQIEALSQESVLDTPGSPDTHLISHLYKIYDEEREIVTNVWTRLSERVAQEQPSGAEQKGVMPSLARVTQEKGPQPMQKMRKIQTPGRKSRRFLRWLEVCAATLLVIVLVGSMVLVLRASQASHSTQTAKGKGTVTPTTAPKTATPVVRDANGLYLATMNGIDRVDLQSNKVVWHVGSGRTDLLQVDQGIVLFSGGDTETMSNAGTYSGNFYVAAANASTGHILWRKELGRTADLKTANGILYDSTCMDTCVIYALKASTGAQVWTYTDLSATSFQTLQNGVLYEVAESDSLALDAKTGRLLWRKSAPSHLDGDPTAPTVSNGIMYVSACDTNKQTPHIGLCTLIAYNATNGDKLWNTPMVSGQQADLGPPTVMDGVMYTGTLDGVIHAYNAQTGAALWSKTLAGSVFEQLQSAHGILYVPMEVGTQEDHLALCEIIVATRATTCPITIDVLPNKPGNIPLVVGNGTFSLVDSTNHIHVFSTTNGQESATYSIQGVATIGSFILISGQ